MILLDPEVFLTTTQAGLGTTRIRLGWEPGTQAGLDLDWDSDGISAIRAVIHIDSSTGRDRRVAVVPRDFGPWLP